MFRYCVVLLTFILFRMVTTMETRYFVKFIGDKHVTVAIAHNVNEAQTLIRNQFEETTQTFYHWVRSHTSKITG